MKLLQCLVITVLLLGVLFACLQAKAQDTNCFEIRLTLWINYVPFPGETCVQQPGMTWLGTALCRRAKGTCPPPPECLSCATAGKPIDLATGDTFIEQTDLRVPGLGGGLTLARTWNSIMPRSLTTYTSLGVPTGTAPGMFGLNWRSTYEERVFLSSDAYMKYARADGSVWSFGTQQCASPANSGAQMSYQQPPNAQTPVSWTIMFKNGEQRVFSYASGSLISIIDRNGNTTQLTYDGTNRLTTVTAAARHLYFNYPNSSSRLVQSVTSDVGLSLSYTYDGNDRLTQVTQIDGTPLNFEYNGQSLLTAVKDGSGKVLEAHTYSAFGRVGLTSSRADGVEHVTITYPICFTGCPSFSF